ncbi:SatD family protein [Nocardioides plantarum]|uniref:SatD family protein n=1 Tax=Nocardioides plantarum TaxID=29299 RepID=A0ABV5K6H6_9ACTN|nr:SatD family protein [Nocardioides plantarum]
MVVRIIGDVVGSRGVEDRLGLHQRLSRVLAEANDRWDADLRITVGDEYQGTVASLGAAVAVTLAVRVALLPDHDVRHGLGRGPATVLDHDRAIEDGPGWWAARAAIEAVADLEASAVTRTARTAYRSVGSDDPAGDPAGDPAAPAVEAALLARDELVGRLDARSLSVLRGLLGGRSQRELAEEAGVSASAVSQRVRRDGIGVVVTMSRWMELLP